MLGHHDISDIHAWVQARLSDYIDNQLAGSDRAQLDKHLGECADCRARLGELEWTLSLLKQAPAPVTRKSFVLAVPLRRQPSFVFGLASFGAAIATILLFAVIGFDLLASFGGGLQMASAPASKAALENVMPTQAIAFAPQPTLAPQAAPTSAPRPTSVAPAAGAASAAASSSAASSVPALPPAPAFAMPTATSSKSSSAADNTTTSELSGTVKSQPTASSARAPLTSGTAISPTMALAVAKTPTPIPPTPTIAPTPTATLIPPTATTESTTVAQIRVLPTRAPNGPIPVESPPLFSPVRLIEIGLLFVVVFMIVLVVLLRRGQS